MQIKLSISFFDVLAAKPEMIYYSANTVFWTHDPKDLDTSKGIPLDCFGSPLLQTEKVDEFLNRTLIENHEAYGVPQNRLRNFMLTHAKNIWIACEAMPHGSFKLVASQKIFCKWCDENLTEYSGAPNRKSRFA